MILSTCLYLLCHHSFHSSPVRDYSSTCPLSHCYQDGHKSSECPVCSHPLNTLGSSLPFAHCAQSRLVCPISGHVMNENNPPMVLPNGYVYGENVSTTEKEMSWNTSHNGGLGPCLVPSPSLNSLPFHTKSLQQRSCRPM